MPVVSSNVGRAVLSSIVVGLLLLALRRASPRTGGLAAAVPINSMPALFWLSIEHGGGYAATAALGSLWGTGLTALLGLTFARLAQVWHAAIAALLACLVVGALAATFWSAPVALAVATGFALSIILMQQMAPRRPGGEARARRDRVTDAPISMGIAGVMSLLVSELSRHGGAQFCGLIVTVPVIGIAALYAGHRQGGAPRMLLVLDGYLSGMLAKAAFLGVLGLAWSTGIGPWAWPVALLGAVAALLAQRRLQAVRNTQLRSNSCMHV